MIEWEERCGWIWRDRYRVRKWGRQIEKVEKSLVVREIDTY